MRNAPKDKKKEFDSALEQSVSVDNMHQLAAARRASLERTETTALVAPDAVGPVQERRSKLPPMPAGWGDAETATRQSLLAAQALKAGNGKR